VKGRPFFWLDSHYSYFMSVWSAVSAISTVLLLLIFKRLCITDWMAVTFGVAMTIVKWVLIAIAPSDMYIYIGKSVRS
jgi:hypothetical protein